MQNAGGAITPSEPMIKRHRGCVHENPDPDRSYQTAGAFKRIAGNGVRLPTRRDASALGLTVGQLGEIPKCGTAQPTIFWNAGAATDPP